VQRVEGLVFDVIAPVATDVRLRAVAGDGGPSTVERELREAFTEEFNASLEEQPSNRSFDLFAEAQALLAHSRE
jgi:hypothetical protein